MILQEYNSKEHFKSIELNNQKKVIENVNLTLDNMQEILNDESIEFLFDIVVKTKDKKENFDIISKKNLYSILKSFTEQKIDYSLDMEHKQYENLKNKIDIEYIQKKKNITTKEFEEIYNISKSSQRDLRGRGEDSLPYHQKVPKGKIVYVVEEVERWFENQHK